MLHNEDPGGTAAQKGITPNCQAGRFSRSILIIYFFTAHLSSDLEGQGMVKKD